MVKNACSVSKRPQLEPSALLSLHLLSLPVTSAPGECEPRQTDTQILMPSNQGHKRVISED